MYNFAVPEFQIIKNIHFVSADEAVSHIKSHSHIHLSSVASVPHALIQALCRRADAGDVENLHFHHFHTEGPAPYSEPRYEGIFFDQGFFIGPNVRANVNAGYADYLPVHLGESQKLYRYGFINDNPDVLMKDIKYTNDPWVISQNPHMKAINSATEVDFTGQACADSIGTRIFSGTGGQLEFVKGASMSEGGKSIIAFASRTVKGKNKIVSALNTGAGVVTPRADAHWVVTEYGAVDLYGKSLQERAKLMISIAHPDDREMLDREAFDRFGPHYHNFSI